MEEFIWESFIPVVMIEPLRKSLWMSSDLLEGILKLKSSKVEYLNLKHNEDNVYLIVFDFSVSRKHTVVKEWFLLY